MPLLALLSALIIAGCGPTMIVMRNPATGQVAQCKGDPWDWNPAAEAATCARGYEAAGYVRSGQ